MNRDLFARGSEGWEAQDQGTVAGKLSCCIMPQQNESHGEGKHGIREQEMGMEFADVTHRSCNN